MTFKICLLKTLSLIFTSFTSILMLLANDSIYGDEELSELTDELADSIDGSSEELDDSRSHNIGQLFFPVTAGFGQTEGRYLGNSQGYTSLNLFASKLTNKFGKPFLPFLDFHIHRMNGGKFASNFGAGARILNDKTNSIFGLNVFYDTYEGDYRYYHQLGIGLEFLSPFFDFRLNGYTNLGSSTGYSKQCIYDQYVGGYFATSQQHQASMNGVEFKFGKWLTRGSLRYFNLYGSIGPYFFRFHKT